MSMDLSKKWCGPFKTYASQRGHGELLDNVQPSQTLEKMDHHDVPCVDSKYCKVFMIVCYDMQFEDDTTPTFF